MGVSTDGQICYGILFEEDFEFPWDNEVYDGDIETWWRVINGYKPPFDLYNEDGSYVDGIKPSNEKISAYFAPRDAFDKEHPILIEPVNVCSHECAIYILALKKTFLRAWRGDPEIFDPNALVVTDEQRNMLIDFCKTYDIDIEGKEPRWYLSSYWG